MLKRLCSLTILLVLLSGLAFALQPISVERNVGGAVEPGNTVQVKLRMKFVGEKPSGIIVTEYPPEGWEVTGTIPAATMFEGRVSWLLYGENVKDSELVYELKAPPSAAAAQFLNGSWETLSASDFIVGDSVVNIAEKEEQATPQAETKKDESASAKTPPAQAQNNTAIYIGAAVIVLLLILIAVALKKKK